MKPVSRHSCSSACILVVDCMRFSIVCGEYHQIIQGYLSSASSASSDIDLEKILPPLIASTHPYFMISTLIISTVYLLLAATSPMPSTTLMCSSLVLYLIVNYLVHLTFFSSCLVITLKRVSSRRHCLSCHTLSKDYGAKTHVQSNVFENLRKVIQPFFNFDATYKKFVAALVCLLSIVCTIASIWFTLSIDTRLFEDKFLPRNDHVLRDHMQSQLVDFDIGPTIVFTLPERIDYNNHRIQSSMIKLLEQCRNESRTNQFRLLWLDYQSVTSLTHGTDSLEYRITPFSHNDIVLAQGANQSTIEATRFYCQLKSILGKVIAIEPSTVYFLAERTPTSPYFCLFKH